MRAWFCLFLLMASMPPALADGALELFEEGNKFYEQGKYQQAVNAYEKVLEDGGEAPALHFNLGNAHFKLGQPGRAILHYRLAQRLAPRDPDVQANLQFVRDQAKSTSLPNELWTRLITLLSVRELGTAFAVVLWLFFGRLAWLEFRRVSGGGVLTGSLGAAMLLTGIWYGLALRNQNHTLEAVVVSRDAVVRFGPLEESKSAFNLREGAELRVTDTKDEWMEIQDGSGRTGWIRAQNLGLIGSSKQPVRPQNQQSSRLKAFSLTSLL